MIIIVQGRDVVNMCTKGGDMKGCFTSVWTDLHSWYVKNILKLYRDKLRLFREIKCDLDKVTYKAHTKLIKSEVNKNITAIEPEAISSPSTFFKFIKNKLGSSSVIQALKLDNGHITTDQPEIAEALADQYCSVFTKKGQLPNIDFPSDPGSRYLVTDRCIIRNILSQNWHIPLTEFRRSSLRKQNFLWLLRSDCSFNVPLITAPSRQNAKNVELSLSSRRAIGFSR